MSHPPICTPLDRAQPFASADEAWWWAWDALLGARAGAAPRLGRQGRRARPCLPHDLLILGLQPLLAPELCDVWSRYGRAGYAPAPDSDDAAVWHWALAALDRTLRLRGWLMAEDGGQHV